MKFCSGNSVIVLVTEQVLLFIIKDLDACSSVLVFLGGMGRICEKCRSFELRGKCKKKHSREPYTFFLPEQNNNIIYIFNNYY